MVENSKNPYIFDDNDKALLDKSALNFLMNSYSEIKKYKNSKLFAKNISKSITTDKDILKIFALISIGKNPANAPLKPDKFKDSLLNKSSNPINKISEDFIQNLITLTSSLNHTAINEKILAKMQEEGILYNISGAEEFKKCFPSSRGRKSPTGPSEENRGRKSIYLVNKEIEQLKKIFQNPLVIDYFIEVLIKHGYIHNIIKFIWETSFYIIKLSDSAFLQALQLGTELLGYKLNQKDLDGLPYYINYIKNLPDEQIEKKADIASNNMINDKDLFISMLPLFGLLKLN